MLRLTTVPIKCPARKSPSSKTEQAQRSRMNELSRLRTFIAVAEAGSFTAAAERLAMTKSAVSQGVASLEAELGVQLLQRSTRRLAVTPAGDTLVVQGRALLAQAQEVFEGARTRQGELTGLLRVTSAEISVSFVAPLIAEYLALHPQMRVEYVPTDQLVDLVREGFDLSLRTTGARDSSLRATGLAELPIWCAASPAYVQARGTPRRLQDLAQHDWIAFSQLPSPWSLRLRVGARAVHVRLRGRVSAARTSAARALALAGAGIVGAPGHVLEDDVAAGRLMRLLPKAGLPSISLYAAWPGRLEPPAKTRAFIELAKARLRGRFGGREG
jgi:DNA-binding transcriptional LysR family regulator